MVALTTVWMFHYNDVTCELSSQITGNSNVCSTTFRLKTKKTPKFLICWDVREINQWHGFAWHGNTFLIIGPLWEEWFLSQKANNEESVSMSLPHHVVYGCLTTWWNPALLTPALQYVPVGHCPLQAAMLALDWIIFPSVKQPEYILRSRHWVKYKGVPVSGNRLYPKPEKNRSNHILYPRRLPTFVNLQLFFS